MQFYYQSISYTSYNNINLFIYLIRNGTQDKLTGFAFLKPQIPLIGIFRLGDSVAVVGPAVECVGT